MDPGADALSREELARVVEAMLAMARASGGDDLGGVIGALLEIVVRATESDRVAYYRLEEDLLVLVEDFPPDAAIGAAFGRVPLASAELGATVRAMRAGAASTRELGVAGSVAETFGIREVAMVPLRSIRGASGALNLSRCSDRPYTPVELALAELVAELFSVFIEHAHLLADARRRLEETRMLLDVSRAITATLDLDRRLQASAEILARIVDASNAFVMLLDDDRAVLRGVAASNPRHVEHFKTVRIPMTTASIAVTAARTKRPVAVEDAVRSQEVRKDLVEAYGEKSILALPLVVGSECIGAIVLDDTRAIRSWTSAEIERTELVAHQIAGAVANARLYDEVRRRSSELEQAQLALVARERLAALGQLAATLAHEVRNPLGVLFNSIGTLRKQLPPGGDVEDLLRIMDEEARRLDRLVRELLDFARPAVPSLETESLKAVVDGAVDAVAAEIGGAGPRITAVVGKDVPPLRIDGSQIRRALVNLVRNAAQAAGTSGRVSVRAAIEADAGRAVARIDVVDDGPGIPEELVSRVFEPFFTTKATGTGLGLAIVRSIVEGHGGEVKLTTARGEGTTVSVLLPIVASGAGPDREEARRPGW
jgi:signal transduction histidine kinase